MSSDEVSTERCGFVLEPRDVPEHAQEARVEHPLKVVQDYEGGSDEWYVETEAVCCWREVWDGGDGARCIWHGETDDEPADELVDGRADGPERLDGGYIPAVELGDAIDFEDCRMWAATFDGTGLEEASFEGVDGRFAQFPGAHLLRAQFPDAELTEAQFPEANLRRAQFPDASLSDARFPKAHLMWAQFSDAALYRAQFPDANLFEAQFADANLFWVKFPAADLRAAQFSDAYLEGAQFPDAVLREAQFPDADLSAADLSDTDAAHATFAGADLEAATLTDADLGDADLTDARLHDAHLRDVRINAGTTIGTVTPEEADADWFAAADLSLPDRLRWWLAWWRADGDVPDAHRDQLDRAHTVYRSIQRLYRENSMPEEIDEYHVRAKDVRRKQAIIDRNLPRWLYLAGQRWVMGYGERPLRVVAASVAVVFLTTLLYPVWGLSVGKAHEETAQVIGYPFESVGVLAGLGKSLYFSVITFTTLGYGDVQPVGFGELLATVESFGGAFLLALLVYVLGRRATR